MPLPMSRLDNRTFDQLVAEGRAQLPRLAPNWTDHNYHDPGITLIDLFAWLVEMDMYRLDRTSPAAYRTFLRLIGIEPRPPQVAETVVAFTATSGGLPVRLSTGVGVASQEGQVRFQTTRSLAVVPAQLTSVLAGREDALEDCSEQNRNAGKRFTPFGPDPQPDDALYLGLDAAVPAKCARVSLYVSVDSAEHARSVRQRLSEECRAGRTCLQGCHTCTPNRCDSSWQHYSARTVWEYFAKPDVGPEKWLPLKGVSDETHGLTLSGTVRFTMPTAPHVAGALNTHPKQFFIRCRLKHGYYECPPEIYRVILNAVPASHAVVVQDEETQNDSNGRAAQSFLLRHGPVVPGSTRLRMRVDGSDEDWREVLEWDRVGPHDRAYLLAPGTGQILFGNGLHGRVPKAGARIAALSYRSGGGSAGNVRAGTLTTYQGVEPVTVEQPFAATGGAEPETLDEAKGRAMAWLGEPRRAITLDDFECLALTTPGVPVKRVYALSDYHPALPGLPASGCVTVVVLPGCARPIPEPGPDMLRAVRCYLDRRRLVTTELHVISPSFITVAVRATLHAGTGGDGQSLCAEAHSRLNTFLDPLRGGADGQGWPVGRDVYQSEVMALLNAIPGVSYVDNLGLVVESGFEVYQGYVRWMQVFTGDATVTTLHAQLRIDPDRPANRLLAQARVELEDYFRSQRGGGRHVSPTTRCHEVEMILSALPGVISVEEANIVEGQGSGALCGNVPVCAHSLIVPGMHRITVGGAGTGMQVRAIQSNCCQSDVRSPKP